MKLFLNACCKKVIKPIGFLTFGFLIILLLISGCTKDETTTSITGTITEEVNNQPMEHVSTWLIATDYETEKTYSDTAFTDENGRYSLSVTGCSIDEINLYINKNGYVFLANNIIAGSNLTKDFKLSPFDSHITFKIANKLSKANYLFGAYWSPVLKHQFMSATYEYIPVPMGNIYKETRLILGDTYIYVTWDYKSYATDTFYPHIDSIYVPRGDTVTYNITM